MTRLTPVDTAVPWLCVRARVCDTVQRSRQHLLCHRSEAVSAPLTAGSEGRVKDVVQCDTMTTNMRFVTLQFKGPLLVGTFVIAGV